MKHILHSKTIWFNVVITIIESSTFFLDSKIVNTEYLPYFIAFQGIGNIILRIWFTKQPVRIK